MSDASITNATPPIYTPEELRSFVTQHWGDRRRNVVLHARITGSSAPCWDAWELRLIKGIPHIVCAQYSIDSQGNVTKWCGREKSPTLLGSRNFYGAWPENAAQMEFHLGDATITFGPPTEQRAA